MWFFGFLIMFLIHMGLAEELPTRPIIEELTIVSDLPKTQKISLQPLLKQKKGTVLDYVQIREDIQTLYLAGDFENIKAEYSPLENGNVHLRYVIKEAPVLNKIVFEGVPRGLQKTLRADPLLSLGSIFYIHEKKSDLERLLLRKAKIEGWGEPKILDIHVEREQALVTLFVKIQAAPIQKYDRIVSIGIPDTMKWIVQGELLLKGIWTGQRVSLNQISRAQEDIRARLVEKGWIQARVNLPIVPIGTNSYSLTIRVEAGPQHRFEVDKPIPKNRIMEILDIYPGDRITIDDKDRFVQKIQEWLYKNGIVDVRPEVDFLQTNDLIGVFIHIPKYKTQGFVSLEIEGVEQLDAQTIVDNVYREVPKLRPRLFEPGIFTKDSWEDALEIVEQLYLGQGFLDVKVRSGGIHSIEKDGKKSLYGKIIVQEGPQLKLTGVTFKGEDRRAMEGINVPQSGVYRPNLIKTLQTEVLSAHKEQGYLDVRIEEQKTIDKKNNQISFVFAIEKGTQAKLETLIIRGNRRTDGNLVRRFIPFTLGDTIRPSLMEQTRKNLYGLGTFQSVSIEPFATDNQYKSLILRVEERPSLFMTLAGGLTSDEGAQVRIVSGHRNLFGLAHKLNLVSQAGIGWNGEGWLLDRNSTDWRVSLRYDAPKLIRNSSFFAEVVIREQLQETNFRLYRSGLKAGASLEPNSRFRALVEYGVQRVDLDDYDPGLLVHGDPWIHLLEKNQNFRWASGGTLSVIWDGRDSPFSPKEGGFVSSGIYFQDGLLDTPPSVRVQNACTYNIDDKQLFRYKLGGDFGGGIMQGEQTLPFDQRFFIGGLSSLRGFARNQAGPLVYAKRPSFGFPNQISSFVEQSTLKDYPGQWIPVGGDLYWTGTAEMHFPLRFLGFPHISIIGFSDIGMLSFLDTTLQQIYIPTPAGIQYSAGMGLRWMTSVGPVAIDFGVNPNADPDKGESFIIPYFSFGNL